jgi:hypothetical protein
MKQTIQSMLVAGLIVLTATSTQAQRNYTGYVGAFDGTTLLNSSGSSSTSYTFQIGAFNYGNVATGTDWFSWNSGGVNSGFTELGSGTLSGGLLSLDADANVFNFSYTAVTGGDLYTSAAIDNDGNPSFGNPLLPYLVLTSARTGNNHLMHSREVLVGQFNAALLGYDPEAIGNENYLGLINDPEFFTALVGGVSGSEGGTTLASASVPEPSSFTLLVAGCIALAALRRRRA